MSKSVFASSQWSLKKSKLAVLVPCRDTLHSGFAQCLTELVKLNTMNNIDTHVVMNASTVLLTQLEHLALEARNIGAEYMLWLSKVSRASYHNISETLFQQLQNILQLTYHLMDKLFST